MKKFFIFSFVLVFSLVFGQKQLRVANFSSYTLRIQINSIDQNAQPYSPGDPNWPYQTYQSATTVDIPPGIIYGLRNNTFPNRFPFVSDYGSTPVINNWAAAGPIAGSQTSAQAFANGNNQVLYYVKFNALNSSWQTVGGGDIGAFNEGVPPFQQGGVFGAVRVESDLIPFEEDSAPYYWDIAFYNNP